MKATPDPDRRAGRPADESELKITRRELMRQAAFAGLMFAFPWSDSLLAMPLPQPRPLPKPPIIPFKTSKIGQGIIGPYGEARVFDVGGVTLPVFVSAIDDSAQMDMTVRSPFVRYGVGASAITLTSRGVQMGSGKVQAWSPAMIRDLIGTLSKDRKLARSVLLLRSALHTAYPVAMAQSKPKEAKSKEGRKTGEAMSKGSTGYGSRALNCTTRTVTDTVTRTITQSVEVIKTAEQQYQECYDKAIAKDPCKSLPFGQGACAATICAVTTFVDMVVGFVDVVTTITEEVTREVVSCVTPRKGDWPNPWHLLDGPIQAAVPQPEAKFGAKEIEGALKLINQIGGFLGPFGKCLAKGEWSLAQLTTPLDLGGGNVTIPYGVRVCIDADCATQLSADNIAGELLSSWGAALGALAALSPEFAASVSSLGITAAPAVVAAIAALPEAVIAAAALILAFIILALIYGTAISAQLLFHRLFTDHFADGKVCIEHATFALALIKLATIGIAPAELIPPIVTG
jgi:hypothetical protein